MLPARTAATPSIPTEMPPPPASNIVSDDKTVATFFRNTEPINTPIHDYTLERIDLNNKKIEFLSVDNFEVVQRCWQLSNQTKKTIPKKCATHRCETADTLQEKKNAIFQKMNRLINPMGPLCIKTKKSYPFDPKPQKRKGDLAMAATGDDGCAATVPNKRIATATTSSAAVAHNGDNVDETDGAEIAGQEYSDEDKDRCLVFPPPSGYTFMSVNIFNKIIKNDTGYRWDGVNMSTGEKVTVDSSMFPAKTPYEIQKTILNTPLRNGTIKSQIQGGPSLMRKMCQCPKVNNVGRGTILPCPSLPPDVVILPASAQHNLGIDVPRVYTVADLPYMTDDDFTPLPQDMLIIMKRDPSLKVGSTVLITRVAFVQCDSIYISVLIIHHMHADFDGDCLVLFMITGWRAAIEATLAMHPEFSMYISFLDTRLIFSQSHALHMYRRLPELYTELYTWVRDREIEETNGLAEVQECKQRVEHLMAQFDGIGAVRPSEMFAVSRVPPSMRAKTIVFENTLKVLNTTLLYITLLHGSREAYKFVMHVTELTSKWSSGKLAIPDDSPNRQVGHMINDNILSDSIFAVLGSGAKGTPAGYCALLDQLIRMDKTILFTAEDNTKKRMLEASMGSEFDMNRVEETKRNVIIQMISNSSKIASQGYMMNTRNAFAQHGIVTDNRQIKYNNTIVCKDYETIIHVELLFPSGTAFYIFINSSGYFE